MRISQNWLQEFVETPAPEHLGHVFEMAGIGVENYDAESGVWTLEITSNRGDWLSAMGLAREIAAMTDQRFRRPREEPSTPLLENVRVDIENTADCVRYVARLIENVRVGDSPAWMQARLIECGMRPVNNIVDATNFVMLETGQPLHAFDADKIQNAQIMVRRAREGESLVTLDETVRVLTDEVLVIADAQNPIAVAGVMGGLDSEVTATTTRVLLESAHFAPSRVRRGARILELNSEASRRFARWVDPNGVLRAAERAAALIAQTSGGQIIPGAADCYPTRIEDVSVSIRVARCNAVLGVELSSETIAALLKRLGLRVLAQSNEALQISVPTWRRDIGREIDLIEEVARLNGYDLIPTTLPPTVIPGAGRPLSQRLEERAREVLLRCGLDEIVTYSLENERAVTSTGLDASTPVVSLRNPLNDDYTQLRTSLFPSLLTALKTNAGASQTVRLFEVGKVYRPQGNHSPNTHSPGAQPDERLTVGIALLAAPPLAHWQKEIGAAPLDFYSLKAIVERVIAGLNAPAPQFHATQTAPFHPGRAAVLSLNGEALGTLGEVHPDIAERFELRHRAYLAQIDFASLVRHIAIIPQYAPISRQPSADRDIALIVPETILAAALENTIQKAGGEFLETARVFDIYQGAPIEPGFKSVALALRFRASHRTLHEDEIEAAMQNIRETVARDLGAQLRT